MTPSVRSRLIFALGLVLQPGIAFAQTAEGAEALAELPPDVAALLANPPRWTGSVTLHSGAGYKDNLLLSRYTPESSGFVRGGVEAFLWRVPEGRTDGYAFVNAEGTGYLARRSVDHEAQAFVQGEWRYRIDETFKFSAGVQGYFLDQVFDVSDTEVQRSVAQLKVTGAAFTPGLRWMFVPTVWVEARGVAKRETYHDGLNNNHFYEGELRFGWRPGARFEASVGGMERRREFDRREQYSEGGRPQAGTRLQIAEREAEVKISATPDPAGHWKLVTRAGGLRYADNGSGYFSYRETKVRQEVEWTAGDWLVRLEGGARRLVYTVQTVGLGIDPPPRFKESYSAELRVERKINARWTVYAENNWEHNRSNNELAGYRMNECLLGVQWNWEK